MKFNRIFILIVCLVLFFASLGWLSDVLVSSEKKSAEDAWRSRFDGIAAMLVADVDETMEGILHDEEKKALYAYVSPSVLSGTGIVEPKGSFQFQKPDYIRSYVLIDEAGMFQTPESGVDGITTDVFSRNRMKALLSKLNATPKYENLEKIKNYDVRLALRMMEGRWQSSEREDGWARLNSPDKGFAIIQDDGVLWALRRVSSGNEMYAQGIAFDSEKLHRFLLAGREDVLPGLSLGEEMKMGEKGFPLSSLPLSLTYGEADDFHFSSEMGNYLKWSLFLIWTVAFVASAGLVWLVIAMTRLERKRAEFVSTVTHELRTPLTSMLLHAEMLEDGLVTEEKRGLYYATLIRECRRLERLIENILSYSRLQRGKVLTRSDSLTCAALFDSLAERVGARLRQSGFTFSYAMERQAGVLLLTTDALSVEQIIDNLTTNAIKYAQSSSSEVILTVQRSQRELIVRFRDNGPGIPRKMKSKIFEPFRRGHSGKPGVGLGLALSRDMARSLGGDLVLESGNLEGACFKLTLPLGPAA